MKPSGAGHVSRILLVDDDEDVRGVLSFALRQGGCSGAEAGSGAEALDLLSRDAFDLIITDFEMPAMRGDELAEKIRGLVPRQRIIMVSGCCSRPSGSFAKVNLSLDKPVPLSELLLAVQNVLNEAV